MSLVELAIEANERYKSAIDVHTSKLQAELQEVEKLIAAVEQIPEVEPQEDPGDTWCIHVENAFTPTSVIDLTQTKNERSPFYEDSLRRARYMRATVPNPFSNSEKRYLEKAIVKQNKRIIALRAKQSGRNAIEAAAGSDDFFLHNVDGIDWAAVARDVSGFNSGLTARTPQECKVRWLGAQHPRFDHSKWGDAEEKRLRELVESRRNLKIDWEEISRLLGTNRTPLDCIRAFQSLTRSPFRWTKELDKSLVNAVREHGSNNWRLVATAVSSEVSANQCQIRYDRTLNPNIKRGKFTAEEDQLLMQAYEAHGPDWLKVAQGVPGRTNTQCRERYLFLMRIKRTSFPWTEEEEARLMSAVEKLGRRWRQVREEMGCAREAIQYADRHRELTRMNPQAKATETTRNEPDLIVSAETPHHEPAAKSKKRPRPRRLVDSSDLGAPSRTPNKPVVESAFASLVGDLTDLEDLTDDPRVKKKARRTTKRTKGETSKRGGLTDVGDLTDASPAKKKRRRTTKETNVNTPSREDLSDVEDRTDGSPARKKARRTATKMKGGDSRRGDFTDLEDVSPAKKKARRTANEMKGGTPRRAKPSKELESSSKMPGRMITRSLAKTQKMSVQGD